MRETKHILPLLLAIVLLCGLLYVVRPDGPLAPLDGPEDPSEPNEPSLPVDPPEQRPGTDPTPPTTDPLGSTDVPSTPGDPPAVEPDPPKPSTPPAPAVEPYEYSADIREYISAIMMNYDSILLVNKSYPMGATASPGILSKLDEQLTLYKKDVQLEITAATALEAMLLCMRADGIKDTYVTSGYRSYQYQVQLQDKYIEEEQKNNPALSREQALAIVRTYSAAPGSSEHQTGLCVDLMTTGMTDLTNEQFEPTEAFRWLQENACQFGFILRYPKGKESTTGYTYESWHYRFVGRDAAIAINEAGLTLEEYLGK